MTTPAALTIARDLLSRLAAIRTTEGFNTDIGQTVVHGERRFQESECPACCLTIAEQVPESDSGNGYRVSAQAVITGHIAFGDEDPGESILLMLQDIHQATELPLDPVGLKDQMVRRLIWQGDGDISYPPDVGKVANATVIYTFSYRRQYGDP